MKTFQSFTFGDMFEDVLNLDEKATVSVKQMNDSELAAHRVKQDEGAQWLKNNPVHHDNIVHHFNQATDDEKSQGESWYSDAAHLNKVLAADSGVHPHVMAGLISNYSPQTHWATNMMTASRVARTKVPLGGKGGGVFASADQAKAAGRILGGESYNSVLAGHKTKAFAHLVEHGHQTEPSDPKVVVDRHAYSVAAGNRITDSAFEQTNLKSKKGYNAVAGAYKKAADHLTQTHGRTIEPHQVQAVTWLVRQRLNAAEEHGASKSGTSKTASMARVKTKQWNDYAGEHHPAVVGKEPGTGYS